jgi:hypothetical protein
MTVFYLIRIASICQWRLLFFGSSFPEHHLATIYKTDDQFEKISQTAEFNNGGFGTTCFMRQISESFDFINLIRSVYLISFHKIGEDLY